MQKPALSDRACQQPLEGLKVLVLILVAIMILILGSCNRQHKIEQEEDSDMIFVQGGVFSLETVKHTEGGFAPEPAYNLYFNNVSLDSFYIGRYEVSLIDFFAFLEDTGYRSHAALGRGGVFHPDPDFEYSPEGIFSDAFYLYEDGIDRDRIAGYPAGAVTWDDAIMYCNWKSEREGLEKVYSIEDTGMEVEGDDYLTHWVVTADWRANGYRLPTEAEWTFAAIGGSKSKGYTYSGSNSIDDVAFYTKNSGWGTRKSGLKKPNEIGLHDMSGNLWEWCWDSIRPDYLLDPGSKNPKGPATGYDKVIKGGAWECEPQLCRIDNRYGQDKHNAHIYQGFRLCRSAKSSN